MNTKDIQHHNIKKICTRFVSGLKDILGKKLYAVYIYGASAFPDKLPTGDIDFHVILTHSLTNEEREKLDIFHKYLGEKYPPLGKELDGYYILLKDALQKTPPPSEMWNRAIDNAWALHRQHILAGRYIHLFGHNPEEIYLPTTWSEIEKALLHELDYIKNNLLQYPDYCILNLARLIYTFQTKDVVISKDKASKWALIHLKEWKQPIEFARKSYSKIGSLEERRFMLDTVESFYHYAVSKIEQEKKKS